MQIEDHWGRTGTVGPDQPYNERPRSMVKYLDVLDRRGWHDGKGH